MLCEIEEIYTKSIKTDTKMNLKWYECVWMQSIWWNAKSN